jgi:hypothetical protein
MDREKRTKVDFSKHILTEIKKQARIKQLKDEISERENELNGLV